jgi:transposase
MTNLGELPATYEALLTDYQSLLSQNKTLSEQNESLEARVLYLTQELARLKRLISGAKSERFIPSEPTLQIDLGLTPEHQTFLEEVQTEQVTYTRQKLAKKASSHGRNPIPAHLPRNEISLEPAEDITGMKRIGEEVTEELDYEPGKLYVNRYVRPKYARADGEGVVIATLPIRPIDKGIAGPGLLAHLAISKYVDHLPLYRQRKQLLRQGVKLASSTLGDWVRGTCELLLPLHELQRTLIQQASYLMVDETSIRVQDSDTKGKCHHGYFWVYYAPLLRLVFFDYRQSRSRDGPAEILRDFSGYLQTDGYQGYDEIGQRRAITHLACFAHARRYFTDALTTDAQRAEWMLLRIQKLYAVERQAREQNYSHQHRYQLRQTEATPVLAEINDWLQTQRHQVLPKSDIGKATAYMLKYFSRLSAYTSDGCLEIDNNLVENAIRPVALGRKNYLFAGSHAGATRAAVLYSLVATALQHDVEPFEYLKDVITRISEHPYKQLAELLPNNCKRTFYTNSQK